MNKTATRKITNKKAVSRNLRVVNPMLGVGRLVWRQLREIGGWEWGGRKRYWDKIDLLDLNDLLAEKYGGHECT